MNRSDSLALVAIVSAILYEHLGGDLTVAILLGIFGILIAIYILIRHGYSNER